MQKRLSGSDTAFTETLCAKARPYIEAQVKQPFLVGLLNGDLPVDRFEYWLKVDYPYLINLAKVQALGVVKAGDPEAIWVMLGLVGWTQKEILSHESHAARLGVPREALMSQRMGPLKTAYTRHQLAVAYHGSLGEILAAILPCKWGYGEVNRTLVRQRSVDPDNPYKDWFAFYTAKAQSDSTRFALDLLDREASTSSKEQLRKMEEIFMTSERYETMCWDAYYEKEEWPTY